MCNQRYEDKAKKLYGLMKRDEPEEYQPLVISYFVKRNSNEPEIKGIVKQLTPVNYDIIVDTKWVMEKIQDILFTKRVTKGRRITLRKDVETLKPYQVYNLSSLCHYARQAHSEGCKSMILSWQEKKMLEGGKL